MRRAVVLLITMGLLVCVNIVLQQQIARAETSSACLGGSGYGGIYDGPYDSGELCSTTQENCPEAYCNCGNYQEDDAYDSHCLLEHVCAGQCVPGPTR